MIKNIATIETALGLKPGEFDIFYKAPEEKEIDLTNIAIVPKSDYEVMSKADFAARLENQKTSAQEIMIKEARTKFNLDFTGKTIDKFAEALKKKAIEEAGVTPDKKVLELTKDLETVRGNLTEYENKYKNLETTVKQKETAFTIDSTINAALPKVKTKIPVQDLGVLFKTKYKPAVNDSGALVFHNDKGEVLKNTTTMNPLSVSEVMNDFQTPYIETPAGGDGGGDNHGQAKPGTYDAFVKEMEKENKLEGTQGFVNEMKKRMADKTLKM